MLRALICVALLLGALSAGAGDYQLVVQDDPAFCPPVRGAPSRKVMTSAEVVAELERSFTVRGHALWGHFSNARIAFCSSREQAAVEKGLVALGARPKLTDERQWRDVVLMLGSPTMLDAVNARLSEPDLSPIAKLRLAHVARELPRWIEHHNAPRSRR